MNNGRRRIGQAGFTLVELLIVVIILAVLAAIVVPQFASSTTEAKEAALRSSLAEMRNAIELYYHQHRGNYPGMIKADGSAIAATAIDAEAAFIAQLTRYSDVNGNTAAKKDLAAKPPIKYGPYLKKAAIPMNPIDDSSDMVVVFSGDTNVGDLTQPTGAVGTDGGWWFDVVSGKFIANTAGDAEGGAAYISF